MSVNFKKILLKLKQREFQKQGEIFMTIIASRQFDLIILIIWGNFEKVCRFHNFLLLSKLKISQNALICEFVLIGTIYWRLNVTLSLSESLI